MNCKRAKAPFVRMLGSPVMVNRFNLYQLTESDDINKAVLRFLISKSLSRWCTIGLDGMLPMYSRWIPMNEAQRRRLIICTTFPPIEDLTHNRSRKQAVETVYEQRSSPTQTTPREMNATNRARCTRIVLNLILMTITKSVAPSLPNPFAVANDSHEGLPECISCKSNR